ncbi:hypothetical protein HY622_02810 [Candidatus Uhrbacteria bacterium]|nr:hypothetical protein [Candidatus Uhrbacteria bacterium]
MALLKKIFSSWIAVGILTVVLILFTYRALLLAQKSYRTDSDIHKLEMDLGDANEKRQQLESMRDLLASDFFAENEARTKFGLQKAGEMAAVVPLSNNESKDQSDTADTGMFENTITDIYQENTLADEPRNTLGRWWAYFFSASSRQSRPRDLNP